MASSAEYSGGRNVTNLQREEVFRVMVESVRDYAIFVLDPNGIISSWNSGAQRIKGYKPEDIIGEHFSIFYPEKDLRDGKPAYELKVASKEGRFEDEGWRLRKDGSRFWANVVITRISDEHGNLIGFGKITRDLTERRIAEQRYRMLVEAVTDYSIYSLDPTGIVTSWNSGAQRIKQYSADEIVGQHFSKFYPQVDIDAGLPRKVLQTAEETGHFEGEGWRIRKDGTKFWSSVVVSAMRDEEGKLTGFSKVTRDITDRKKLLDELQRHTADLEMQVAERERAHAELESFSYSVSHDLRAPLRAIEGFGTALREDCGDKLDEVANDYLSQIMAASSRMNRLVTDLLDYASLSRVELLRQPIPLRPILDRVVKESVQDPGKVTIKGNLSGNILAHGTTVTQILTNLLSNAIKFRKPGAEPHVEIVVSPPRNGKVKISVTDSGIGIAPQHIGRIFKVFERLHAIDEYPGTGIGLAIVKRGAERMGGSSGVESRLGEGSTFWVEMPEAT